MTKEEFLKAKEIVGNIGKLATDNKNLQVRSDRFNDYIEWMDGRHNPITFAGRTYKKVEVKFNMLDKPTDVDARDLFDIVEENKKDFVAFLKKCQKNYDDKIKANEKQIEELDKEFGLLGNEMKATA